MGKRKMNKGEMMTQEGTGLVTQNSMRNHLLSLWRIFQQFHQISTLLCINWFRNNTLLPTNLRIKPTFLFQ
jgi:hypothetical protein